MKNDLIKKNQSIIDELVTLLGTISYGSLEVYIQDHVITQLTVRNIKKTKVDLKGMKSTKVLV